MSTVVRAVARALVAVVLAVGIWVLLYAIADNTTTLTATLRTWWRHRSWSSPFFSTRCQGAGAGAVTRTKGGEPEQLARKIARAVVAVLVAAGIWAGAYAYAVDLSRDNLWGAVAVFIGPPIAGLASLIYLKLPRRRSG